MITGVIKANIPSRIAFQVASKLDSRVILDENGADRLLGQGDMMYLPPGTSRLVRAQGVLVTDEEIHRLVEFAGKQAAPTFEPAIADKLEGGGEDADDDVTDEDEELVKVPGDHAPGKEGEHVHAPAPITPGIHAGGARGRYPGERRGIVGPENGAKGREILVDLESL